MQDHRQFAQRYYEYLDYFRFPDGPIFLRICGEGSCNGIANDYIGVSIFIFLFLSFSSPNFLGKKKENHLWCGAGFGKEVWGGCGVSGASLLWKKLSFYITDYREFEISLVKAGAFWSGFFPSILSGKYYCYAFTEKREKKKKKLLCFLVTISKYVSGFNIWWKFDVFVGVRKSEAE